MALAVTLPVAGCGIGDKQRHADAIVSARDKVVDAGAVLAVLRLQSKPRPTTSAVQTSTDGGALAGLAAAAGPATLELPVQFDFAAGRTGVTVASTAAPAVGVEGEPAPEVAPLLEGPAVIFERDTAFVQRVNRRPAERRVWARLDFGEIRADEVSPDQSDFTPPERLETLAKSVNPGFVLDLAVGTLAGSVERVGPATVEGVAVTHYRGNVSLDKALSDLDLTDDDVETRTRLFRLVGLRRDVNPADYWITEDGQLRRARFRFEQRLFPRVHDVVSVTLDLQQADAAGTALTAPADDRTIRLTRYARFVRTAVARVEG